MQDTRLLIALDDSHASRRAVKYVAKFVGRRKGFRICLVHVLRPLPPELLEHGGSEDPAKEARLQHDLEAEQNRWIATAKKEAQKNLDQAATMLRKAGISARTIQSLFCEPGEGPKTADVLLDMAKECRCGTVVVGRRSASWLHELFSQDLSEELLRRGKGFCVWAVE
ncbi:MAG: universal stress protein [Acidobacteriota bacterium]|nr:universal stress protein [Acidobacteriota bacterium]